MTGELIAVRNESNLPAELEGFTGLEGIDSSDLIIPRFKVVQPISKEVTPGTLRINLTGDEFRELNLIAIKANKGRVLWDNDAANEKPLCRSYNFWKPDESIEQPFCERCAEQVKMGSKTTVRQICPKGKWGSGGEKPECREVYNLLCLKTEDALPFWLNLHGASISPVRRFLSAIALRRSRLWEWETTLTLEERKEIHRRYAARFATPKPISEQMEREIFDIVAGLKDEDVGTTYDAEERQSGTGESSGDGGEEPEAPAWMGE